MLTKLSILKALSCLVLCLYFWHKEILLIIYARHVMFFVIFLVFCPLRSLW